VNILLIGFGNVGRRCPELLISDPALFPWLTRLNARVIGIVTRTRGSVVAPDGVDLARALKSAGPLDPGTPPITALEAARSLDYDVLVELSTLAIAERGEPAASYIRAALRRGRHAVTANKGPVAFAFGELAEIARSRGVQFLFESTVMDGAPVFNMARASLKACTIRGIAGVLNSTTNSILSHMEEGMSPDEALRRAQRDGFAEADPRLDLEGWDPAAKLAVLSAVLMGVPLPVQAIDREGITQVLPEDLRRAREDGKRLKLIGRVWREGSGVRGKVGVEAIPLENPLATVRGSGSAIRIDTDLMGPLFIVQENPGPTDTACGVLNDILTIAG
jgi:homoserine dehydrogenase